MFGKSQKWTFQTLRSIGILAFAAPLLLAAIAAPADAQNRAPQVHGEGLGFKGRVATGSYQNRRLTGFTGAFRDPDGDTLTFTLTVNPARANLDARIETIPGYEINGPYFRFRATGEVERTTVTVTATDPDGLSASDSMILTTSNNAPTVKGSPYPDQTLAVGNILVVKATDMFTDPDGDEVDFKVEGYSGNGLALVAFSQGGDGLPYTLTGETTGEGAVTLTGEDIFGATVSDSFKLTVIAAAAKPEGFAAISGDGQAVLAWAASGDSAITKYRLRYKAGTSFSASDDGLWSDIAGSGASTTSHTVTGLANGTEYVFQVRAVNAGGVGPVSDEAVLRLGAPLAPGAFRAVGGNAQAALNWEDPSDTTVIKYQLRYKAGTSFSASDAWSDIAGSGASTTAHSVTGLTNDTAYIFQIRAVNANGTGSASEVRAVTPRTSNQAPKIAGTGIYRALDADIVGGKYQNWRLMGHFSGGFTDPDGDALTFSWTAKPAQANLDVRIEIRPGKESDGPYLRYRATGPVARTTLTVTATDIGGLQVSDSILLTTINSAPTVKNPPYPDQTLAVGNTLTIQTTDIFTDADGDEIRWYLIGPSPGDKVDADRSGKVVTVTAHTTGEEVVTVSVTGLFGANVSDSFKVNVIAPAAAPTGLTAAAGDGRAALTWTDPGNSNIAGYQVRHKAGTSFSNDDDGLWTDIAGSGAATTGHIVTGLANGTEYVFQIRADAGGPGAASGAVTATPALTAPAAPTDFDAEGRNEQIVLRWKPPANTSTIDKMRLRWKETASLPFTAGDAWTDLAGAATGHTVTGLANGTSYSFELRAVNISGAGPAASTAGTPAPMPKAPAGLSASVGNGRVTLSWSHPADPPVTRYRLRHTSAASFGSGDAWTDLAGLVTSHTVTGLANGVARKFELQAVNTLGAGPTASVAGTPRDLAPSFGQATVADRDYERYRAIAPLNLPAATGGDGALTYSIAPDLPAGLTLDSTALRIAGAPTGTQDSTAYSFTATDADGDSATLTFNIQVGYAGPPAPANITATPGDGQVTLSWEHLADSNLNSYYIMYRKGSTLQGNPVSNIPIDAVTSYTVTGLDNGEQYAFALFQQLSPGLTPLLSDTITATPGGGPGSGPGGLAAMAGDGRVALSWNAMRHVTRLDYRQRSGGNAFGAWTAIPGSTGATIRHVVTGLTNGVAYDFQLRAVRGHAAIATSNTVQATPAGTATVDNRPPRIQGEGLGPRGAFLKANGRVVSLRLGRAFTDPDGDALTYSFAANPAQANLDVRAVTGSSLGGANALYPDHYYLRVRATGPVERTTLTVTATDPGGLSASDSMVLAMANREPTLKTPPWPDQTVAVGGSVTVRVTDMFLDEDEDDDLFFSYFIRSVGRAAVASFGSEPVRKITVTGKAKGEQFITLQAQDVLGGKKKGGFKVTVVGPPDAPAGLAAAAGDGRASLTWTDPGDSAITGYQVRHKAGTSFADGDDGLWTDIAGSGTSTTGHTVTGLANGAAHVFQVRAAITGVAGDASATVTAMPALTAPAAPTGLAATPGDGQLALAWTLPTGTIDKVQLRWKATASLPFTASDAWTDLAATATSHTATSLTNGAAYSFELRAVNTAGAGPTASIAGTPQDLTPSFGQTIVAGRLYTVGSAIAALTLPSATGGNSPLAYTLTPTLPAGLALDAATRTVSGTPTSAQSESTYSWTATDADGDTAKLTFTMAVQPDARPSFGAATIADRDYEPYSAIATLTLPQANGGNGTLAYSLTPDLPAGLALDSAARTIGGTPTAAQNATAYSWAATDADGDTVALTFTIAATYKRPAAPTGFAAAAGDSQAVLSWSDPGDSNITGYRLRYKQGTAFTDSDSWADIAGSGAATASHVVTGLQNNTQYVFQIRAVASGGESAPSAAVSATPAAPLAKPAKPTGLSPATTGNAHVTLSWNDPSNATITRYELRHTSAASFGPNDAWSAIPGSSAATTERDVAGLVNDVARRFQIRAVNASGAGPASDETLATPRDLTPAFNDTSTLFIFAEQHRPVNTSLPNASGGDRMLSYSFAPQLPAGLTFDAATHRFVGAPTATQSWTNYSFKATDADGDSATLNVRIVVEYNGPPLPANFTATPGNSQVTLSWEHVESDDLNGYVLTYRKGSTVNGGGASHLLLGAVTSRTVTGLDNGEQYAFRLTQRLEVGLGPLLSDTITATPSATPGQPGGFAAAASDAGVALSWNAIATASRWDYRQQAGGGAFGAWRAVPGSGGASTGHLVTGLTNGTAYGFQIRAVTGHTATAVSGTVSATPAAGPPGAVTSLAATASTGAVGLTWSLPADTDNIDKLQVRWKQTSSLPFTASDSWTDLAADATRTRATGLTDTVSYSFAVRAVNGQGASDAATVVATPESRTPAAPTGLAATAGLSAVTLVWNDPLDATVTGYQLRYTSAASFGADDAWNAIPGSGSTGAGHTITGLDIRTVWRFQIRAVNGSGPGVASAEASVALNDLTPSFGAATVADRSYRQATAIAALTLPVATGGDGAVAYALTPALPAGLALDMATRTVSGTPTALQAATTYSWTATDADGDNATLTFTIAVEVDTTPSFGGILVANRSYTQGTAITAFTLPAATGGNGTLSYALTPTLPAGLALDAATRTVSGAPTATLAVTTYSWTATDADGDTASVSFTIEVTTGGGGYGARRAAFAKSLAGLAAKTLGQAQATIGQRLEAAPGASSLTVAGRRVEFGPAAGEPAERDWRTRRAALDRDGDSRVSWEELRRDSAFEMSFGEAGSGLEMTAWGRGGLMRFEAEQAGIDHRSRMETGWLGMDARVGDGLLMGLALSRSAGETEASDGAGFTTALSAAWPYAQLKLASGAEVWTMLGAGNGSVDYRPAEGAGEREALEMRLASAGGRQPLADVGALGLALEADAGFVTLETGGSARSVIGGHEVQVWRARASLEAEHEGWGLGGGSLAPFGSLAWRGDGGDWREGSGVEAGFGARLSAPGSRFTLEAEGRHLALSSEAGYGGTGASLTAGLEPASDGAGLSWSMSLASGVRADGAAMLADDLDYDEAGLGADENRMALELEARYGFRLPAAHGLISPLLRLSEEEGVRRKLEAGLAFEAAKGRVDLELTGGHEARKGSADDHRLRLDLRLGF